MKVGIDISQIVFGGGVSIYTENLVRALLKIDKKNQYSLFFSSLRRKLKGLSAKQFKLPPSFLDFLWNRLHVFPIEYFLGEIDVFHSSDWTQPPAKRAKLVTTIHDLSFLRWPESVHPKVLAVQKRRLAWVKKQANAIIAVSKATKKETIELLGVDPAKIWVIYEGVPEDVFTFKKSKHAKINLKSFGIRKPYIFAYGSSSPRKNIGRLIRAFLRVKKRLDFQLVVCGDYQLEEKVLDDVILTGFLSRAQMLSLFSQASVFVYPSIYEGFGLPILEAFALGVPVVTSDVSSMPEVAGEAAILVNPESEENIASGIENALARKESLLRVAKERLRLFTWEDAAEKTLAVYRKVVHEKS